MLATVCEAEGSSTDDELMFCNRQALLDELRRRRSGSKSSNHITADVHYCYMPSEMERKACLMAAKASQIFETDRQIAQYVKQHFDKLYGKAWQCICGRHFGSFVTFEPENFIYFRIGGRAFMLFRAIEVKS